MLVCICLVAITLFNSISDYKIWINCIFCCHRNYEQTISECSVIVKTIHIHVCHFCSVVSIWNSNAKRVIFLSPVYNSAKTIRWIGKVLWSHSECSVVSGCQFNSVDYESSCGIYVAFETEVYPCKCMLEHHVNWRNSTAARSVRSATCCIHYVRLGNNTLMIGIKNHSKSICSFIV